MYHSGHRFEESGDIDSARRNCGGRGREGMGWSRVATGGGSTLAAIAKLGTPARSRTTPYKQAKRMSLVSMELLCECSCRLNRGHQPGTLTPLGKPTSFPGFEEEGIFPGTGQATRPIQDLPDRPGRHHFQSQPIQGSGWALCKGPVGHAVGVGPGGPPAASAALSAGRRTASPNPIGHTRAGIARVTSQQHLSRRWVLLCCSDFPVDFSVGNSFPTLIQADFSFCHRRPLAFG